MVSSGMLRRVALVRIDILEERRAYIFRVTRISELGKKFAVISNRSFSKTSALTKSTQRKFPEDVILHSNRCENLKSYIALTD
jgi:hypothetical protein